MCRVLGVSVHGERRRLPRHGGVPSPRLRDSWETWKLRVGNQPKSLVEKKKVGEPPVSQAMWRPGGSVNLPEVADQKNAAPPQWDRGMWGSEGRSCELIFHDVFLCLDNVVQPAQGFVVRPGLPIEDLQVQHDRWTQLALFAQRFLRDAATAPSANRYS